MRQSRWHAEPAAQLSVRSVGRTQMVARYESGEDVHVGDTVTCDGMSGRIVFVIDRDEFSDEFPERQWSYLGRGFMFRSDDGILIHYDSSDECCDFRLIARNE